MVVQIDWDRPVCTRHRTPLVVTPTGQRGGTENRRQVHMSAPSHTSTTMTAYYPDDGVARFDRQPCDWDLDNYDPADGIHRVRPIEAA